MGFAAIMRPGGVLGRSGQLEEVLVMSRLVRIGELLVEHGETNDPNSILWISRGPTGRVSRRDANKFLLGCILDYQIPAGTAWENARRLAEDIFRDADPVWDSILAIPFRSWESRFRTYKLHRFPHGHNRVWLIGQRIVEWYDGDARGLWEGCTAQEALENLLEIKLGEQLSRMAVGLLKDARRVAGKGDVKADIHVRRAIGRACHGEPVDEQTALETARQLYPSNPWRIDRPLWDIGKQWCRPRRPRCSQCYLKPGCTYVSNRQAKRRSVLVQ